MNSVTGIITEYNPFHNGHLYHLNQAKKKGESDYIICVMNGNFTQRGLPALTDKWSRTKMALASGVDLVIELPLIYGIRSAEYFADGSVQLLSKTGIVQNIVFGSEAGDIRPLTLIAEILSKEPSDYKNDLQHHLKQGDSFPAAREKALISYIQNHTPDYAKFFSNIDNSDGDNKKALAKIVKIISSPNNILGIEYIKSLIENDLSITPLTIKRVHNNYHSLNTDTKYASATAIRGLINQGKMSKSKSLLPNYCYQLLKNEIESGKIPLLTKNLGMMILGKIRQMTVDELSTYSEINNGLENRYKEAAHKAGTINQLIDQVIAKSITRTRIQRNLLHILFGLNQNEFLEMDKTGPSYLRILGFSKRSEKLLSYLKEKAVLPMIIQPANYIEEPNTDSEDPLKKQLSYDILAGEIYSLLYKSPDHRSGKQDFYQQVVKN